MHPLFRNQNLRLIFGVTLMSVLGVSTVIPVIPNLAEAFSLDPAHVGLVMAAFTLPGVFLTPVWGVVADRMGRRKVLLPSLVVFALAGASCALAKSFVVFLALRVVQGSAAAALGVISATLLGDFFHGQDLATATGLNAAMLAMGMAGYPLFGGILGLLGWRWPFLLPLL
ncbi:major facilitator superfamily MFS_1, partial [Desulfovibrio sp. X2]|uniref:MFS transporter n=1 Tax=Desulfovibrio sp. X2 TaxID=941449 RepID=UPI000358F0A2